MVKTRLVLASMHRTHRQLAEDRKSQEQIMMNLLSGTDHETVRQRDLTDRVATTSLRDIAIQDRAAVTVTATAAVTATAPPAQTPYKLLMRRHQQLTQHRHPQKASTEQHIV